jgi:riboflavin synthase
MFTGIVEEMGSVLACDERGLQIQAPSGLPDVVCGDSVAVDGACLTVVERGEDWFRVEIMPETLRRTRFAQQLPRGTPVNLERSLAANGRFGGHLVQGHVEAAVAVLSIREDGNALHCEAALPAHLYAYVIPKGFVALNGVSLTVIERQDGRFSFALIPYTRTHTNLGQIRPGSLLNLESDIVGRYVVQLLSQTHESHAGSGRRER